MVKYAYENTVYYKRSFDEAGVKPEDITSLADIEKFPFIDKKTERETAACRKLFRRDVLRSRGRRRVYGDLFRFDRRSHGKPLHPQEDFDLWQSTEARLFWPSGYAPERSLRARG